MEGALAANGRSLSSVGNGSFAPKISHLVSIRLNLQADHASMDTHMLVLDGKRNSDQWAMRPCPPTGEVSATDDMAAMSERPSVMASFTEGRERDAPSAAMLSQVSGSRTKVVAQS